MLIYGHRGAAGEAPENTLAGFRRAVAAGVLRVELDLHLSLDDTLVVIHDPTLNRTTNGRGRVRSTAAAALQALDARRGGPGWPQAQGVPTLEQVLDACPEILHYQLECKSPRVRDRRQMAERLAALYAARDLYSRATVTSFDVEILRVIRRVEPRIPLGLAAEHARPDPVKLGLALGVHMLALGWKLCTAARIRAAHAAGLQVSAWTVNDRERARELAARGLDSLITDLPSALADLGR